MRLLVAVALGGALGAVGRYLVTVWVQGAAGGSLFPWGTMTVNVGGSFLLGLLMAASQAGWMPLEARPFLAVGLLGSFTTFSTFSLETVALLQVGQPLRAGAYAMGSLVLGVAAAAAGLWLAGARGPQ